jgi:hypothetical protein
MLKRHDRAHRGYVGGRWDEIGPLQLHFMVQQGLQPHHTLLDIACGSLRAGVHFIRYLDEHKYLGIEKEQWLIDQGLRRELPRYVRWRKRPIVLCEANFDFVRLPARADFSIAHSLFTHLTPDGIELCLRRLREYAPVQHRAFITYQPGDSEANPSEPSDMKRFHYSPSELEAFARNCDWSFHHIGEWGHPRGQLMFELTDPSSSFANRFVKPS